MKDEHTYGQKMARKGRTKVIYKGTFISIQTLSLEIVDFIQYKKPMVLWSTFFKMPKTKYVHSIQCNDLQKKISIQCRAMIKKKNRNCRLQIAYGAHIF